MPSLRARLLRAFTRKQIYRRGLPEDEALRHIRKALNSNPLPALLPKRVTEERVTIAGVPCLVISVPDARNHILYLHGGGFVAGKVETYRNLCGRLADALDARVVLPDYRLAPEHPFPAPSDDCLAVYEAMLSAGAEPARTMIGGDSAGGCLTLSVLLRTRDNGAALPAAAFLLSPATDLTMRGASMQTNADRDMMLGPDLIATCRRNYAPNTDPTNPYASPVYGDYAGFPPLLFTVEETECLRDDIYAALRVAQRAGVETEVLSRDGLVHVWPIFVPFLPEAREDVAKLIGFMRRHLPE